MSQTKLILPSCQTFVGTGVHPPTQICSFFSSYIFKSILQTSQTVISSWNRLLQAHLHPTLISPSITLWTSPSYSGLIILDPLPFAISKMGPFLNCCRSTMTRTEFRSGQSESSSGTLVPASQRVCPYESISLLNVAQVLPTSPPTPHTWSSRTSQMHLQPEELFNQSYALEGCCCRKWEVGRDGSPGKQEG